MTSLFLIDFDFTGVLNEIYEY